MGTDSGEKIRRVRREALDEVTRFARGLALDRPRCGHSNDAPESRPALTVADRIEPIHDRAFPHLHPAVRLLGGFRGVCGTMLLEGTLHVGEESPLIAFYRKDVIALV